MQSRRLSPQTPITGRMLRCPLCRRYQLIPELGRLFLHVLYLLLFILLLILVHAQRVILHPSTLLRAGLVLEHLVHRPRYGVRRCHRCLRGSQPGTQPPIQRPERTVRLASTGSAQVFTACAAILNACPARFLVFNV